MKGTMFVEELNETGLYVSELCEDKVYKSKANPRGTFVMVIEPYDEGDIRYKETEGGFLIDGEAYILEARKDILKRRLKKWEEEYKMPEDFEYVQDDSLQM